MDALTLLHQRVSSPLLDAPAPSAEQIKVMLQAALRAPDHGGLRPWRFLQVSGAGLVQLGQVFADAAKQQDGQLSEAMYQRYQERPLRAPLILVAIACFSEHPKVPRSEQLICAGCAAHGVIQAAFAQGIGAMWRSGEIAENRHVAAALGLTEQEQIIGFIYLGKVARERDVPQADPATVVHRWGDE